MDKGKLQSLSKIFGLYGEMARKELESFHPFALLSPIDMLRNRYDFEYWPDGFHHGNTEADLKGCSWNELVPLVRVLPDDAVMEFDFGKCSEWVTCYDLFADRKINIFGHVVPRAVADPEKVKRKFETEWPWVVSLWNGNEAGAMLRDWLVTLPQGVQIQAKYLKDVITEI
jgi:hypothetical protein